MEQDKVPTLDVTLAHPKRMLSPVLKASFYRMLLLTAHVMVKPKHSLLGSFSSSALPHSSISSERLGRECDWWNVLPKSWFFLSNTHKGVQRACCRVIKTNALCKLLDFKDCIALLASQWADTYRTPSGCVCCTRTCSVSMNRDQKLLEDGSLFYSQLVCNA